MNGTLNRVLLALCGLVLVALGGSVLAVGLGADPPSWWIHDGRGDVLLSESERQRWHDEGWWWWVVIAVLALCLLLALSWFISALRRRRLAEVLVDSHDDEIVLLRGRAVEGALEDALEGYDGVGRAKVVLTGRREAPQTRVRLRLEPHASPAETLRRFRTDALADARRSTGLNKLPSRVRLRSVNYRAERVN